jgi:antitoxin HigA-1
MFKTNNNMRAIHPGEILREEYLIPLKLKASQLAKLLDIPATRIHAVIHEKRSITADTAYRLAKYFGSTPEFWLNLQAFYDLKTLSTRAEIDAKVHSKYSYA